MKNNLPARAPDPLPHTLLSLVINRALQRVGQVISWVWLLLLGVIVLNVLMRYVLGEGRVEFEEIQWHLYSIGFLLGISVCLDADAHIRVDLISSRLSPRMRAWIELYGLLLMLLPFILLVLIASIEFVRYAYVTAEISDAPGGLGYRWLIKAMLPLGFVLMLLAAFGRLLRVSAFLFGTPRPVCTDTMAGSASHEP